MAELNPLIAIAANFRRLLAKGKPVAVEDAARNVNVPDGFDRRAFGSIPLQMLRDGEITEAGFRRGVSKSCNQAPKRLWVATELLKLKSREGNHRG